MIAKVIVWTAVQQQQTAPEKPPTPAADLRMSRDPYEYERIANDPSVLPFIVQKGQGEAGLTGFFEDANNLGFLFDDCAFLCHYLEEGVYEVHSMALPHARGRYVFVAATIAIRCMFFATTAMELLTRVVEGNVGATALTKKVGFSPEFSRAKAWEAEDGAKDVHFFAMRYPEWVKRQDWLRSSGEWFHSLTGISDAHPDDPAHDLYVGAALEMILAGQPDKGCFLYNRWARFAGYDLVSIVEREPLTMLVSGHLLTLENGKIEVTKCQ